MVKMTLWQVSYRGVPTFYLDSQVQGILNAEIACKVASAIVGATVTPVSVMAINYDVIPQTGYENIPVDQLEKLITQHMPMSELSELDDNDALILGNQLIEWSRR